MTGDSGWEQPCARSLLLYLSRLGQNCHCHGAGVDTALLLCPRHSLHSVHSSFKFQVFVGFWASNAGWRMPKATLKTGRTESLLPFCHALFKLTITCILMKYNWKRHKLIIESKSTLKNFSKSLISGVSKYNIEFKKKLFNFMSECHICTRMYV